MSSFVCDRKSLLDTLSLVATAVPSRTTRDILKNIHVTVTFNSLTALGTDTEIALLATMTDVASSGEVEVLLPARILAILRETDCEKVAFEVADKSSKIKVTAGGAMFTLAADDVEEYPKPEPSVDGRNMYSVSASELRKGLRRTVYAADDSSTRFALGGVLLHFEKDVLTFAATDSRRLSIYSTKCSPSSEHPAEDLKPVVLMRAVMLIEKILADCSEDAVLAIEPNSILVSAGDRRVFSRLVEGRYPRYRDVVPSGEHKRAEIVVGPFLSAVRQAMIITNEDSRGVDFHFAEGEARLSSKAAEIGESAISVPLIFIDEEAVVMLEPRYVADFLRSLAPEDAVTLEIRESLEPVLFRAGENYAHVIMPLARD